MSVSHEAMTASTERGFYMIQPNQAAAITLFGAYRGTDRNDRACAGSGRGWARPRSRSAPTT
jgi:hypothetical protein